MTFDVVGHLLLARCEGIHSGSYSDCWFDANPGSSADLAPHFYAPDLVNLISESDTDHEICTHTFSHVVFDEMTEDVIQSDLERAVELHRRHGLEPPRSLVPPRHQRPTNELIESSGIDVVRVADRSFLPADGKLRTLQWMLFRRHPIVRPEWNDGILETVVSPAPTLTSPALPAGQRAPHTVVRSIPSAIRQRLHARYLENALARAIDQDGYLHLWTHLYNLASNRQLQPVLDFLRTLARTRDEGRCRFTMMKDLPELLG